MNKKRTLYECSHARVNEKRIYCSQGYPLLPESGDGSLDTLHLEKGEQLALKICQQCIHFDSMGPPVPVEERGWLKVKEMVKHDTTNREALREAVA